MANFVMDKNKKIALIVMVAILVVAIIATTVTLIVVSDYNVSVKEGEGFKYSLSKGKATILAYTGEGGEVTVPNKIDGKQVVGVAEEAFKDNTTITSLTFKSEADNFTLGDKAFYNMKALTSIVLPDGVKAIPANCFSGDARLASVTMGNDVATIGSYAFSECSALSNIYISTTSGGKGNDENYTKFFSMTMPEKLQSIGDYAFYEAMQSTTVYPSLLLNTGLVNIGNNAFDGCTKLRYVEYADKDAVVALENIGNYAFYKCENLKFSNQKSDVFGKKDEFFLTKAMQDNILTTIGDYAFSGSCCSPTLTAASCTLVFRDGLESVGSYAFQGVSAIKSIKFYACNPTLNEGAFHSCSNLDSVVYYDDKEGNTANKNTSLSPEITSVPKMLFYGCAKMKNFIIGEKVTSIGDGAFAGMKDAYAIKIADADSEGKGANFALYKLPNYYTKKSDDDNVKTYSVANSHYLLMSSDYSTVYAYIGGFSVDASAVKNDNVSQSQAGKFTFLQNITDININTIKSYAFGECGFDYIYLPEKLTTFGESVFNGVKKTDFYIFFEGKTDEYYTALINGGMSADFIKGITFEEESGYTLAIYMKNYNGDIRAQLEDYLKYDGEIVPY